MGHVVNASFLVFTVRKVGIDKQSTNSTIDKGKGEKKVRGTEYNPSIKCEGKR